MPPAPTRGVRSTCFAWARSAATVHCSFGMCLNGSYEKCFVVFFQVILWMSSSGTPWSDFHSTSGALGQVESECG